MTLTTSTKCDDLAIKRQQLTPKGLTMMTDIYIDHAINAELFDVDGNRYIDFATGTSTMSVGHSHPRVLKSLHEQVDKFIHTFYQQLPYESYLTLAERLNIIVPGQFNKKTAFFVDGAGAVENALKIARAHTKRSGVIAFHGGYHGRTLYTSSLGGKVQPYKNNLGSPVGEVYHIPFPSDIDGVTTHDTTRALERLFKYTVSPDRIASIIVEPVQGEGGFRMMPAAVMSYIRQVCDAQGIVLIADEVQSGFGRTGKMFAMEHYAVSADLTVMSKCLAAGIPMSAVTGRAEIMDAPEAGGLGGTYNGTPLGCVAGNAVLDIIEDERLIDRSIHLGARLMDTLKSYDSRKIVDVRGIGSMVALQLDSQKTAKEVQRIARGNGLILLTAGINGDVIRFMYPLTIEQHVFTEALVILDKALKGAGV